MLQYLSLFSGLYPFSSFSLPLRLSLQLRKKEKVK
nr:MAG TPA: hypothetical protein [Caudoviricetes sp.]